MARNKLQELQNENWNSINTALSHGLRGLSGGDSIANLLERNGRKINRINRPKLTDKIILKACDKYYKLNGKWPKGKDKTHSVPELPDETFRLFDIALNNGMRGLPGGDSLFRFLVRKGRIVIPTLEIILKACDKHYKLNGKWPTKRTTDSVPGLPDETWPSINERLKTNESSLAKFLEKNRGRVNYSNKPKLTEKIILDSANEYYKITGSWPSAHCKPNTVPLLRDETWNRINEALTKGFRGLPGNDSLSNLLDRNGKKQNSQAHKLTKNKILKSVYKYHKLTNKWPTQRTKEPVPWLPNETWMGINSALSGGWRGLSGKSSLSKLLQNHSTNRPAG
jgi:hypothetical protein